MEFLDWFSNIYTTPDQSMIFLGDFNLIRNLDNRNKPGGNTTLMLEFNSAISQLGILEIALRGQYYTWLNKQQQCFWRS